MSQKTPAQLMQVNPCAHALVLAYARNHPHDRYTDVAHAQALLQSEGQAFPRSTIAASFSAMELCGLGHAFPLMDEPGEGKGFQWAVLPGVVMEALRTGVLPDPESAPANNLVELKTYDEIPHSLPVHRFRLRPDCTVCLNLPDDLTTNEANRLSMFLQSLVREDGWPYATRRDFAAGDDGDDFNEVDEDELDEAEVQAFLDGSDIVDEFGDPVDTSAPEAVRPSPRDL